MTCGAIILAAGASTRLGTPKQAIVFQGETLLDRSIRIATEAGCAPIVVVLGAHITAIEARCQLINAQVIHNPRWEEGMGTSLAVGAATIEAVDGVIVMTCDMPSVSAVHLRKLGASARITASHYAGQHGVPAYFPSSMLADMRRLNAGNGAKTLLRFADSVELLGGDLDIDTPEDLAHLR